MIEFTHGNLFESDAAALVNTVNRAGVAGKGLALEFRKRYPAAYNSYRARCQSPAGLRPGELHTFQETNGRTVVNFATKHHWRQDSDLALIEANLKALAAWLRQAEVASIALPPLGCGLGNLDWNRQVKPLIIEHLGRAPVRVIVYEPASEPPDAAAPATTAARRPTEPRRPSTPKPQ